MKKKTIVISALTVIILVIVLAGCYYIGSGFNQRLDVALGDFSVSEDGTELTFNAGVMSSMGFIRGFKDSGGGVKAHYLTFYSTFGGLNSSWGARNEFTLKLDKDDSEIFFNRDGGGFELVLQKNAETGKWERVIKK